TSAVDGLRPEEFFAALGLSLHGENGSRPRIRPELAWPLLVWVQVALEQVAHRSGWKLRSGSEQRLLFGRLQSAAPKLSRRKQRGLRVGQELVWRSESRERNRFAQRGN